MDYIYALYYSDKHLKEKAASALRNALLTDNIAESLKDKYGYTVIDLYDLPYGGFQVEFNITAMPGEINGVKAKVGAIVTAELDKSSTDSIHLYLSNLYFETENEIYDADMLYNIWVDKAEFDWSEILAP